VYSFAAGRSNLVDMAHDTSIQFGEAPPLFARPPGWSAATVSRIKTPFFCESVAQAEGGGVKSFLRSLRS
jgi:hypothetical protein